MRTTHRTIQLFFSALCLAGALQVSGADFSEAVRSDTRQLSSHPSRITGSEGHARASAWIEQKLGSLEGVQVWTHEFPVVMPVVEKAELTVAEGPLAGTHSLHPLWPDSVRLNSTAPEGIQGKIHYVGDASIKGLPAKSLQGNIAAMEMADYQNWKNPFRMNASAVLLLGSPDDKQLPPAFQPLHFPRYYIPEGPLADAIREKKLTQVTVHCQMAWKRVTAKNYYALVLPPSGSPERSALGFTAAYDAMSIVMDQAPGADNAVDTAFLLNMAEHYADNAPARPLLFAFVDAYSVNQLGMRQFLTMLTSNETNPTREEYLTVDQVILEEYETLAAKLDQLGTGKEALDQLHDKRNYRDIQRALKDVIGPELLDTKEQSADIRLKMYKGDEEEKARLTPLLKEKMARVAFLNRILVQILTPEPVVEPYLQEAVQAYEKAGQRIREQVKAQQERISVFSTTDTIRNEILGALGKPEDQSPIAFLVGIDLSDAGFTVGPGLYGGHLDKNETIQTREFTRWLKSEMQDENAFLWSQENSSILNSAVNRTAIAGESSEDAAPGQASDTEHEVDLAERTLNRSAVSGTEDPKGFNIGGSALLTSPASSFQVPSVTWKTLSGLQRRMDTPQDRFDRLDWDRLNPQIISTKLVLNALISNPDFNPEGPEAARGRPTWRRAWGSIVGESVSETVPRTPMPGFLVTLVPQGLPTSPAYGSPGIRRQEFVFSQIDGGFTFFPAAGALTAQLAKNNVQAYKLNNIGQIEFAQSDTTSMIQTSMPSDFDLNQDPDRAPARLLAFRCVELNGPEFFDPRFLEPLTSYNLIDPMTGGKPKRSKFSIVNGQMWGALMPDTRWQLLLRAGTASNRMILMNLDKDLRTEKDMKPQEAMRTGFNLKDPLPSIPAHISASDFFTIDAWRLNTFQEAGISSAVVKELHRNTADLLAKVEEAIEADEGGKAEAYAVTALANELRVYEALLATGSDVTRGAIFLMILIVPFAVAMERLLFACVKIGNRIIFSALIFTTMTLLLWSFHPAFRITNQPLIIVMAFAVLLLSLFVIIMIFKKFEADLEEMKSGQAERGGAQTSRGGVIGSAIWLGIANMRKRKLRTFLTAITIVLITFALLCFSSSTTYQNKRQFEIRDVPPPFSGILFKQPAMTPLHPRALDTVNNLVEGQDVIPRYWWTSSIPTWRLHARNLATHQQVSLKAALGLSPLESKLSDPGKLLPGWEVFAEGNACYLSEDKASQLGVQPGDRIGVGGQELILAGTFSGDLEEKLLMLDGQSILPFDFTIESDSGDSAQLMADPANMAVDSEADKIRVPPDDLIILPASLTRDLGGDLRSMGIATANHTDTKQLVNKLSEVLAFPLYFGTEEGTEVISSTPLIPKVPRNLITPLVLAALIIFNTMLNSVAERKKEIHIYTSLGLAPVHVGMLFLSEALTYGLMGSVFGYIAGQGLAAVLTGLDLMGGITLNYSGSSVIMTMGLVIGVVVLSSIVPAVMAGKLASPSDEMKWKVPDPVDGVIRDQLPFTIHREAAPGLIAFIHEYVGAHEEGTIGHFASADLKLLPADGNAVAGIESTVWLAPYDLGVRQNVILRAEPESEEESDVCSITIELHHEAGQPSTWWRQNRTFLGDLRKQLLGWRKVTPERILHYIEEFKAGT